MIFELLQWALLHLLQLVVLAEAWLTSNYKGEECLHAPQHRDRI